MSAVFLTFIFVLSIFLGFELISKVPSTLHTPLMSGSNAISGITLIGALAATLSRQKAHAARVEPVARHVEQGVVVLADEAAGLGDSDHRLEQRLIVLTIQRCGLRIRPELRITQRLAQPCLQAAAQD